MIARAFRLCLLVLSVYAIGNLWFLARDGFCVRRIAFAPQQNESAEGEKEEKALSLLDQSYYYLAKGRQCYAFVSADQKTVLKIPRFDRYRLPLYCKILPLSQTYLKKLSADRTKRLQFLLGSLEIAGTQFAKETALLYSHLHQTKSLTPKNFVLYDRLHRPVQIDLNQTVFALQEKHSLVMPLFLKELKKGNRQFARELLGSLLDVIKTRADRGIFNKDAKFLKNYCWKEGQGIQIDIGSFYREEVLPPELHYSRSVQQGIWPIYVWLTTIDPEFAAWVKELLDEVNSTPSPI